MTRWEFLIQKEGDRAWLSVTEPTVDLEEGRYRIVANTNCVDLNVEIRLTYQIEEDGQFTIHSHKYYRRTNSEGLVMISPFTDLKAGFWKLRCCGDIMSELLDDFWQQSLQVNVIAQSSFSTWQQETWTIAAETEVQPEPLCWSSSPTPQAEQYLQQLEYLLRYEIEPMLQTARASEQWEEVAIVSDLMAAPSFVPYRESDIAPVVEQESETSPVLEAANETNKTSPLEFAKLAVQELQIVLDCDMFDRVPGDAIAISGTIEAKDPNIANSLGTILLGKLMYELRNPQTGKTCIVLVQSLPETTLPHRFCCSLEVPSDWEVSMSIGTVILETSAGFAAIRQPFLVTTDAEGEVKCQTEFAIATPDTAAELSRAIDRMLSQEAKSPPLNLDLPEPSKMSKRLQPSQSVSHPILPPKLIANDAIASPQLPPIPKPRSIPIQETVEETKESEATSQQEPSIEEAFDSLNLEEHFLQRLNALAL